MPFQKGIPITPLSFVSTTVLWEGSQWLSKDTVQNTGQKIKESMDE